MKRFLDGSLYPAKWYQDCLNRNYDYFEKLLEVETEIETNEGSQNTVYIREHNNSVDLSDGIVLSVYTYNNFETVKLQFELFNKNIEDFDEKYIVLYFDDSTDLEVAKQIRDFVTSNNQIYVKVPRIAKNKKIYYHNQSLNYSCYKVLQYIPAKYFGLLDHDIFPIAKLQNFENKLKNYPVYCKKGDIDLPDYDNRVWYPWPGFFFFHKNVIKEFNFFFDRVCIDDQWYIMDTGGAMFRSNFMNDNINTKIKFANIKLPEEGYYPEYIDNSWVHLGDLSNWSGTNNIDKLKFLRDNFLLK